MKINAEAGIFSDDDDLIPDDPETRRIALSWFWWILAIFVLTVTVEIVAVILFFKFAGRRKFEQLKTAKTLVVLGSGGHTAEIMKLMESLDMDRYTPRVYAVAETDSMSGRKVAEFEKTVQENKAKAKEVAGGPCTSAKETKPWELFEIPRSREVGQSYITSIWTTLQSFLASLALVGKVWPEVVVANGPGTCIPVCFAAAVFRLISTLPVKIIYVESIARTRTLSLSGKILYHLRIADLLLVQWKEMEGIYPRTKFVGRLY